MAGRRRGANRGAGQAGGGRGQQAGAALPRNQQAAAAPRGQQAGAAPPRGQQPGAPRGQQPGAAPPRGQHPGAALPAAQHREEMREVNHPLSKNPNRQVDSDKKVVIKSGTPFKSEYTLTKVKNLELEKIFDEMKCLKATISVTRSTELCAQCVASNNQLLDRVKLIRDQIKNEKGMPLPIPKPLEKKIRM